MEMLGVCKSMNRLNSEEQIRFMELCCRVEILDKVMKDEPGVHFEAENTSIAA